MMRKISFKIAAIALASVALVFAGCSKENGSSSKVPDGKPAYVTLSVKGNGSVGEKASTGSRAIDTNPDDQAAAMEDFTVFILGPANEILGKHYIKLSNWDNSGVNNAKGNVEIPTTTSARHIYVVGNTGSDMTTGSALFGTGVTTLAQLQTAYLELENISPTALWIEGHTTTQLNFIAGAATDGSPLATAANIQMNLIPARVDVYVNNNMKNYGATGSMTLDNISFLNSAGYASPVPYNPTANPAVTPYSYAPADDIATLAPYYRSGVTDYPSLTGLTPFPVAQSDDLIFDWFGGSFEPTSETQTQPVGFIEACSKTFYALPGGSRTKIVTVVATLSNNEKVYFPIHFGNNKDTECEFESGKRYVMTINLNGYATTGGGGVTDPETPAVSAFVTVTVKAAKWEIKNLPAKNFN